MGKFNVKLVPIKTTALCSYGCGQIAKYKLKNGKICCNKNVASCPTSRKKNSNSKKLTLIETTELCSYGCGQVAKYKLKNGKLCCKDHINKCPINNKKINGKNKFKSILIKTNKLCSYGCGQVAKYKLKNGKLCCNNYFSKCPIIRKKIKENKKAIPIKTTELCSYGCGQVAKYKLKNRKLCCENHYSKCSINNKKLTSIETTKLCSYGCGQQAKYKLKNGNLCCNDHYTKCPINRKKNSISHKLTINQIKKKYPTFYKEEDLRYNPDKPNKKEIQVRCKYNKCKNSKEQNGWFTPTNSQIHERIRCIEKPWGWDGEYFYCSDECKENCILFGLKSDPFKENKESPHTSVELNIWREECLQRQFDRDGYNSCEMCGSRENLQVHHEKPQKTHPGMTLDPDNGIILCKDCHYKIGHKTGTECSTGNLANKNPCD